MTQIIHWRQGARCCNSSWEEAYKAFETQEQEIRKFVYRIRKLGLTDWPKNFRIVELFCGRGNGLKALEKCGFTLLEGVDLSESLLADYKGPARLYVGDCRELSLESGSRDAVIIQGGLHHLSVFPEDLMMILAEARRVLRKNGFIVIVEPWLTPFLRLVHLASRSSLLRHIYGKIDAFARMTELELATYEQWLAHPGQISEILNHYFVPCKVYHSRGKLMYIGSKEATDS
jgi:SAM-dependent methyltransferase